MNTKQQREAEDAAVLAARKAADDAILNRGPRNRTRHANRPRGVTVKPLDLTARLDQCLAAAQARWPDEGYDKASLHGVGQLALGENAEGTLFLISDEGVGWEVDGVRPEEVDVSFQSGNTFSMFPQASMLLSLDELVEAETGEEVDLADFIRTFGSRLDSNHREWFHTLGGE